MFSTDGITAITGIDRLQESERAHGAEHGAAAAHVVLHLFHVVRGLDRDAAGIERDALADQSQHRRFGARRLRLVAHHDHARRLDASLRHADERAHFQLGDSALVENFDAEADFLRHGFGALRENARRELVRRLVDQVAGEILRFGDHAAVLDGGLEAVAQAGVKSRERDGLNFALFLFGAVLVRFKIRRVEPFDDGLRRRRAALPFARQKHNFLHAAGFQITQGGSGNLAQVGDGKFAGLPRAHKQQPLRGETLREMDQHEFERLAGEFAAGGKRAQAAAHGRR